MSRSGWRSGIYRAFQADLLKPLIVPRVFKAPEKRERIFSELLKCGDPTQARKFPIGWFHAASVGELEMLSPVIGKWAALRSNGEQVGVVITVFSESAEDALEKLRARLAASGARVIFAGFSPWEGEWDEVLAWANPEFVMSARYEAWPDLWISLGNQGIPLIVVGAQARSSLKWASRVCRWLGEPLPEILFCPVRDSDCAELRTAFAEARIVTGGDPRWERVFERAHSGNERARELIGRFHHFPRPWGVLGSAWKEDLTEWSTTLREKSFPGTLWIVPHKIDEAFVAPMEALLDQCGITHARVSDSGNEVARSLIVNEMGFLAELYSSADWAYVGGGFGEGVHNAIEPAIYGIPVGCGTCRSDRFPEIAMLESIGQLRKLRGPEEISAWVTEVSTPPDEQRRVRWKEHARSHLGSSETIIRELSPWLSGWQLEK